MTLAALLQMVSESPPTSTAQDVFVIVAAYNEADRIAATLAALSATFPGASLWVADDGSSDGTGTVAETAGATVVRSERVVGKGGAVALAARQALRETDSGRLSGDSTAAPPARGGTPSGRDTVVVLCDGDLGEIGGAAAGPL